ncbi:DUF3558 domain-containing protein [Tsukamurella soli]|uniref:DUF3558 domain-containing protein n=1 Tax=Tsukamurella soli TaxID=644556 RepID=A0ABP8JL31_9ACTN
MSTYPRHPPRGAQLAVCVVLTATVGGCTTTIPGEPIAAKGSAVASQTAGSPPLPFAVTFTERWNHRNDGSSFEPCTAYSSAELRSIGIDPASVSDAAGHDSPNIRGCHWKRGDAGPSQFVTNPAGLDRYKRLQRDKRWSPDTIVNGRRIAVATGDDDTCGAAFESQRALVVTLITAYPQRTGRSLDEECAWVVRFASMAAARAP